MNAVISVPKRRHRLRPGAGELLVRALGIYGRGALAFVAISLISCAPAILPFTRAMRPFVRFATALYQAVLLASPDQTLGLTLDWRGLVRPTAWSAALVLWFLLVQAAAAPIAARLAGGERPRFFSALLLLARRAPAVLAALLIKGAFFLGIALITDLPLGLANPYDIPTLIALTIVAVVIFCLASGWLYGRLFAVPLTVLLATPNPLAALGVSQRIARGELGTIFGALGLLWLLIAIVQLALVTAAALAAGALVAQWTAFAFAALAYPLVGIVSTLLYIELEELDRPPAP